MVMATLSLCFIKGQLYSMRDRKFYFFRLFHTAAYSSFAWIWAWCFRQMARKLVHSNARSGRLLIGSWWWRISVAVILPSSRHIVQRGFSLTNRLRSRWYSAPYPRAVAFGRSWSCCCLVSWCLGRCFFGADAIQVFMAKPWTQLIYPNHPNP